MDSIDDDGDLRWLDGTLVTDGEQQNFVSNSISRERPGKYKTNG